MTYEWPGNVRELRNMVERLVIMAAGDVIGPDDLPPPLQTQERPGADVRASGKPLKEARDNFERAYILAELRAQDWNMTRTAERLGIERSHLYRKIRAYGIIPPKRGARSRGASPWASHPRADVIVPVWNFIQHSAYHDSVTLMRLTRDIGSGAGGVTRAAAMMGTPPNRALLAGACAADRRRRGRRPHRSRDRGGRRQRAARPTPRSQAVETALTARAGHRRHAGATAHARPAPCARCPTPRWRSCRCPVRTPGAEARAALRRGLDVMLFSDNVPLATEVALKREALERGRFVMGPDCGTAILHGVPLGFANAVPAGASVSWPPPAPGCRKSPAVWPPRVRASRTRSASAAATCPTRSAAP